MKLPAKAKASTDAIIESYRDKDFQLSPEQEEIKKRCKMAWSMLASGKLRSEAVDVMMQEFGISESQAYRDIQASFRVYGNVLKADKEGWRQILIDMSLKMFQKAEEAKDYEAMGRAILRLSKITGIDKEDGFDPSMLEGHVYKIGLPSDMKKLFKQLYESGAINLDDIIPTVDIEAKILSDDEEED